MVKISNLLKNINKPENVRKNEAMELHTWFKTGGAADWFITPELPEAVRHTFELCRNEAIPVTIIGDGANLLVADSGIRGVVISLKKLNHYSFQEETLTAEAGCSVDELVSAAFGEKHRGLEFLSGMPGTLGGALYMNARCYGSQISDILESFTCLDKEGKIKTFSFDEQEWDYKQSPLQEKELIALNAVFTVSTDFNSDESENLIETHRKDRKNKGHFKAPCAGSFFKNNRDFGAPSGKIIEEAGLKGMRYGGAAVSDWHANIIINEKNATAREIRFLSEMVQKEVFRKTGCLLEPEVQFAGDWSK